MTLYLSLFISNIARLPLYGQTEGHKEPKCRSTPYISKSFNKRIYIPFYNQQYENTTHTTMLYIFFLFLKKLVLQSQARKKMCLLLAPLQTKKKKKMCGRQIKSRE